MGNTLKKRPLLVFWAAGEACLMGGVTFDISISVDGYTNSASQRTPDSAIRDGRYFAVAGTGFEPVMSDIFTSF
jgi:hypothetical protein